MSWEEEITFGFASFEIVSSGVEWRGRHVALPRRQRVDVLSNTKNAFLQSDPRLKWNHSIGVCFTFLCPCHGKRRSLLGLRASKLWALELNDVVDTTRWCIIDTKTRFYSLTRGWNETSKLKRTCVCVCVLHIWNQHVLKRIDMQ